jgi:hypothetical protein
MLQAGSATSVTLTRQSKSSVQRRIDMVFAQSRHFSNRKGSTQTLKQPA